jgi:hypothetical protein
MMMHKEMEERCTPPRTATAPINANTPCWLSSPSTVPGIMPTVCMILATSLPPGGAEDEAEGEQKSERRKEACGREGCGREACGRDV